MDIKQDWKSIESNFAYLNGLFAKPVQPQFGLVCFVQLSANQLGQFRLKRSEN